MSTTSHLLHQPFRLHDAERVAPRGSGSLHDRINEVVRGLSFREVADITGLNAETIRRYVRGADPSVAFITRLCEAFDLSAEWLLHGRGPRNRDDAVEHALCSAGYGLLFAALADRLENRAEG